MYSTKQDGDICNIGHCLICGEKLEAGPSAASLSNALCVVQSMCKAKISVQAMRYYCPNLCGDVTRLWLGPDRRIRKGQIQSATASMTGSSGRDSWPARRMHTMAAGGSLAFSWCSEASTPQGERLVRMGLCVDAAVSSPVIQIPAMRVAVRVAEMMLSARPCHRSHGRGRFESRDVRLRKQKKRKRNRARTKNRWPNLPGVADVGQTHCEAPA